MNARDSVLVTIAIPTIDRPDMLERAIRSALSQTHANVEVLVSDNASAGDMRAVCARFSDVRLRFQRHSERLAMADHWNTCLAKASGAFFLLLSDDDYLLPDGVARLLAGYFRLPSGGDDAQVVLSYGRAIVVDGTDRELWRTHLAPEQETLLAFARSLFRYRRAIYPCATLHRTALLRRIGGYDASRFGAAADLAACLLVSNGRDRVSFASEPVCHYTEHTANLTGSLHLLQWKGWFIAIRDRLLGGYELTAGESAALSDAIDRYVAYLLMDFVGKRAVLSGRGMGRAFVEAIQAVRQIGTPVLLRPSLRLAAKLAYLQVRRVHRSTC